MENMYTENRKIKTNRKIIRQTEKNKTNSLKPNKAGEMWELDVASVNTNKGALSLCLIADRYSHKILAYQFEKELTPELIEKTLSKALKEYSKPSTIVTDRGQIYTSLPIKSWFQTNRIEHLISSNHKSATERFLRFFRLKILDYGCYTNLKPSRISFNGLINIFNSAKPA